MYYVSAHINYMISYTNCAISIYSDEYQDAMLERDRPVGLRPFARRCVFTKWINQKSTTCVNKSTIMQPEYI